MNSYYSEYLKYDKDSEEEEKNKEMGEEEQKCINC